MQRLLWIAFGGSIGAVLRYLISKYVGQMSNSFFPMGTMVVNLLGCFFIGFIYALSTKYILSTDLKSMLLIGFIGAFTTFSTYIFETSQLLREGEYLYFIMNILLSNVLGILLFVSGLVMPTIIVKILK